MSFKHVRSICFLLMLLKKHVKSTCYLNNMCFSHVKGHMSILYVGCRKFLTNRFVENFCLYVLASPLPTINEKKLNF